MVEDLDKGMKLRPRVIFVCKVEHIEAQCRKRMGNRVEQSQDRKEKRKEI
jgi:hypothetical protein